jgi:hypothetical protein
MQWDMEINQDSICSKLILKEQPIYLSSGKLSKRTKIPFMDVWKKCKDGLKQVGFGIYKENNKECEIENWVVFFRTKTRLGEEDGEKKHISIRDKYYNYFCEI